MKTNRELNPTMEKATPRESAPTRFEVHENPDMHSSLQALNLKTLARPPNQVDEWLEPFLSLSTSGVWRPCW